MKILAIETSCDESSVAIVDSGFHILSNVISSQIDLHRRFGGVVPELASRAHQEALLPLIEQALEEAQCVIEDIDAFAVTYGPGLSGALMVGLSCAKSLSLFFEKPLIGVNHVEAHIYANFMGQKAILPCVAMIVSGGHTLLAKVSGWGKYEILGQTRDDAAGEAFDKVANMLKLGYPGGPIVDRLAKQGDRKKIFFPRAKVKGSPLCFSFSGLKTAVLYHLREKKEEEIKAAIPDICASFQEAVVDVLCSKSFKALEDCGLGHLAVGGGVSMNSRLREAMMDLGEEKKVQVTFPGKNLSADNAAMIGGLAYEKWSAGIVDDLELEVDPCLPISNWVK